MEKETTPTPIEQIALEKYPIDLGHGVGNGIDYNYNNRLAFLNAFTYLRLSDIPDPEKWVEEMKAVKLSLDIRSEFKSEDFIKICEENQMLKRVLKSTDDNLTCINWEGEGPIRLKLEAEIERLKEVLGRIYTMDTTFENYINAIVELRKIAGDAIK
jgi:hypothetical protein